MWWLFSKEDEPDSENIASDWGGRHSKVTGNVRSKIKSWIKRIFMKLLAGILTLILISGKTAGADHKPVSLIHKTRSQGIDFLQPVFPLYVGVVQEKGTALKPGDFLQCKPEARRRKIVMDGNEAEMVEMVLKCKDGSEFLVRGLEFEVGK
jgi:hypothetical protein